MTNNTHSNPQNMSVGIVGCGWLGKALAANLLAQGVSVLATSSQQCNVEQLHKLGIEAQQLQLPSDPTQLKQHDIFSQQCLVIAITPQLRKGRTDYVMKVAQVVDAAKQRGVVQQIILLSSTAVYQGLEGIVDENSNLHIGKYSSEDKVKILHDAELAVLGFHQGSVIRLSGLVGPQRHPGKFLRANKTLKDSTSPVNLIHQQDAVGIILSLLTSESEQGIFNGVSDTHVTKASYYQAAAKSLGLTLPTFSSNKIVSSTRIVSGEKVKQQLGYSFIYPDLLAWL